MREGLAVYEILLMIILLIDPKTPAICQAVCSHCCIALCNKMYPISI